MRLIQNGKHYSSFFHDLDSEDLLEKNLKTMPADWPWRNKTVRYTRNSQGYRAPDWSKINWEESILLFGCSFVYGVGISDEDTCSYQLTHLQNKNVINLGVPGSGPMIQWANTTILRNNGITPRAVIYMWPSSNRTTLFLNNEEALNFGPWSEEKWAIEMLLHPSHGIEYLKYAKWSVDAMWSCPVLHYCLNSSTCNAIENIKFLSLQPKDRARDWNGKNSHPGPLTNKQWAETMSNDLNGLW